MESTTYEITQSGQLIKKVTTSALILNPETVLKSLKDKTEPLQDSEVPIKCFYNIGDGITLMQKYDAITKKNVTWGSIIVPSLQFLTDWMLVMESKGQPKLVPHDGANHTDIVDIGAPLQWICPLDLIIQFTVKWSHETIDIFQTPATDFGRIPAVLGPTYVKQYYLTCFSLSRKTCVRLPFPNLYDDGHLCVGSSFSEPDFSTSEKHWGITRSIKSYVKAWSETRWNLDLIGAPSSPRLTEYQELISFNPITGIQNLYTGCDSWERGTSSLPLDVLYAPWIAIPQPLSL